MAPRPMQHALRLKAARLWRIYPREILALGLLAFAGSAVLAGSAWSNPTTEGFSGTSRVTIALPAPPPLLVRDLPPEDAVALNRAIPIDEGPNPAARPFSLARTADGARAQALECLTSAVYYEAGNESADGQKAVAQVVLNRVRHPAFPTTVCGVVYEGSTRPTGCQFTFTCDGSLARRPSAAGWATARKIAWAALTGAVYGPVGHATHYHAEYVVPYWASSLKKNAIIGAHIFYRWSGNWGQPGAFTQRYAQREPDSQALRTAAAQAPARRDPHELKEDKELAVMEAIFSTATPIHEGKRVGVRFNMAAREAAEAAPREPYVDKVSASDNLRWTLSGGGARSEDKPLGRDRTGDPSESKAPSSGSGSTGTSE